MYIPFPPADVFNNSFAGCDERIRKIQKKRGLEIETESLRENT